MSPRTLLTTLLAAASASVHGASILSCADVDCPITEGTTSATCTIADRTFNAVGLTSLDTGGNDRLRGLSWVKAVGAQDHPENTTRVFDESFYLGTRDDFDFEDTGACAVFFTQVSGMVRFGEGDQGIAQGTCGDALGDACDNLDSACSRFAMGAQWTGVEAKPITGDGAPEEIEDRQNRTTNCWPVLPKTDDLTLVQSVMTLGDFDAALVVDRFFSITPILTVFFPENDNDSDGDDTDSDNLVTQTVAQLTCIKAIDMTTASNATQSPGGNENGNGGNGGNGDGGNAAGRMVASGSLTAFGGLLAAALVLLA
ncbi:hypothetical protein F5144DRAFT_481692 [Chaetomium tenue]|uniref:Uncharacterized protein n=1 Tax=Chaetomium tenue TaxID=1854479 RepID=A0ACB7PKS2_9PEZI|nr:hypothetical protein F5144DRAFT_481692 [Chaetomium globosum]